MGMVANKKALSTWYPETLVFKMPICHVLKRLLGAGCLLGASLCWVPSWLSPCCMVTPVNPKWNEKQQHQIALQKCEDTICNRNIMFFFLFCFVFNWEIWMSVVVYAVY